MVIPNSLRKWLRLPSRIALLLGTGALSITGAQATLAADHGKSEFARMPETARSTDDMLIWIDGGRIFVSESGQRSHELFLGDTAEARLLKQTLEGAGAFAKSPRTVPRRMILAGSGGMGFHHSSAAGGTAARTDRKAGAAQKNGTETDKTPQPSRTPPSAPGGNGGANG